MEEYEASRVRALGEILHEFDLDMIRVKSGDAEYELVRRETPVATPAVSGPPLPAAPVHNGRPRRSPQTPPTGRSKSSHRWSASSTAASPGAIRSSRRGAGRRGQTLCILEAMKLMNEITSEFAGIVTRICRKTANSSGSARNCSGSNLRHSAGSAGCRRAEADVRGRRPFEELLADRKGLLDEPHYPAQVAAIAGLWCGLKSSGKVLWFGNGGSAADAQHLAAEFSGRFLRERRGLHSESLSVNTSALTAISNDFGYEHVFARQMESFAQSGDVVVGITTSGSSRNIVLALEEAKRRGAVTVAFTGNGGGRVAQIADLALLGPDGYSAIIQEVHITMGHIICDLVEQALLFES